MRTRGTYSPGPAGWVLSASPTRSLPEVSFGTSAARSAFGSPGAISGPFRMAYPSASSQMRAPSSTTDTVNAVIGRADYSIVIGVGNGAEIELNWSALGVPWVPRSTPNMCCRCIIYVDSQWSRLWPLTDKRLRPVNDLAIRRLIGVAEYREEQLAHLTLQNQPENVRIVDGE